MILRSILQITWKRCSCDPNPAAFSLALRTSGLGRRQETYHSALVYVFTLLLGDSFPFIHLLLRNLGVGSRIRILIVQLMWHNLFQKLFFAYWYSGWLCVDRGLVTFSGIAGKLPLPKGCHHQRIGPLPKECHQKTSLMNASPHIPPVCLLLLFVLNCTNTLYSSILIVGCNILKGCGLIRGVVVHVNPCCLLITIY